MCIRDRRYSYDGIMLIYYRRLPFFCEAKLSLLDICKCFLVDRLQDIGKTDDEISRTAGALCAHGFEVEVAGSGQVFSTANEDALPEEQERQGLTMGGI